MLRDIAVNVALIYLAIGALGWTLFVALRVSHLGWRMIWPTLMLCLLAWPYYAALWIGRTWRDLTRCARSVLAYPGERQ